MSAQTAFGRLRWQRFLNQEVWSVSVIADERSDGLRPPSLLIFVSFWNAAILLVSPTGIMSAQTAYGRLRYGFLFLLCRFIGQFRLVQVACNKQTRIDR